MGAKLGESGWNGSTHLLRRRSATLRCLVGLRCGHFLCELFILSVYYSLYHIVSSYRFLHAAGLYSMYVSHLDFVFG
jgi:hypothetical protein